MSDAFNFSELLAYSTDQSSSSTSSNTDFLRLRLTPQFPVLLSIQQLTEVLNIPENQIMPIPDLPTWVMGVHNWRGEILWMIDLSHLCGLQPWYQQPINRTIHSAIVLNADSASSAETNAAKGTVGIVVRHVEEIESFNIHEIQPLTASLLPGDGAKLTPFAIGCWQKSEHEVLTILDAAAILDTLPHSLSN